TIATMRGKRRELVERGETPLDWSWLHAKRDKQEFNPDDDWIEQQARDWAHRFGETFGKKLVDLPEIAARALQIYSERLPLELVRFWQDEAKEVAEEVGQLEF